MKKISIIIISYNTKDILLECLNSIDQSQILKTEYEVIIVDNASSDNSLNAVLEFKKTHHDINIRTIQNKQNLGFSKANNIGIRIARGEYILLLNSDVILNPDTLSKQKEFMDGHTEYAFSTCKLMLANRKMDPACHRGFPTPWASFCYFTKLEKIFPKTKLFGQYHQGWKSLDDAHNIDAISGAFFWVRKALFETVGLLDEGFFMYGEDLDLCLRAKQQGLSCGFNSDNSATHLKGQSGRKKNSYSKKEIVSSTSYHFWNAMLLFYRKHYQKQQNKIMDLLIIKILKYKIGSYEKYN